MEIFMANTIKELFSEYDNIEIPPYQRAYSWYEKQWDQFLDDLNEQRDTNKYYLGQFIFEKEKPDTPFFVIDGQQRLTTILIFLSVAVEYLEKNNSGKDIAENIKRYFKIVKTIKADQRIFERILTDNLRKRENTATLSQGNLIKAAIHFSKELAKKDVETILKFVNTIENASITIQEVKDRLLATQIFEYQNNRGEPLSDFEIIKAYLLQQIYANNTDRRVSDKIVNDIQENYVSEAFRCIEAVVEYFPESELEVTYFTESELLDATSYIFCEGIDGNIEAIKETLKGIKSPEKKINWIQKFFKNFCDIASDAKDIINSTNFNIFNLFLLGNRINWKLVLLAIYSNNENHLEQFEKIVKVLNVLTFKMLLTGYHADYLKDYVWRYCDKNDEYTIDNMYDDIKNAAVNGFLWYWNNDNAFAKIIKSYFQDDKYHYGKRNLVKFVLWNYENSLRKDIEHLRTIDTYRKYTIEHIHPISPKKEDSEHFKGNYLHIIGNLNLLTGPQNSRFGPKDFDEKKDLYQLTTLVSYTAIRGKEQWTRTEISERNKVITDFVVEYFKDLLL